MLKNHNCAEFLDNVKDCFNRLVIHSSFNYKRTNTMLD